MKTFGFIFAKCAQKVSKSIKFSTKSQMVFTMLENLIKPVENEDFRGARKPKR